jgi:hypothetical protein
LVLGAHLAVLCWVAYACHARLAAERPPVGRLTEFYLCVAIGGAVGGAFNGLVAPLVFTRLAEYPLMLLLAAFLCGMRQMARPSVADVVLAACLGAFTAIWLLPILGIPESAGYVVRFLTLGVICIMLIVAYTARTRPWRFALGMGGVLLASSLAPSIHGWTVYRARSYFGVHVVADRDGFRRLVHGGTVHGMESLSPASAGIPLTYFYPTGPIGRLLETLQGDPRLDRVGVVGLGPGSLAYYSRPGQRWTFFEIDPAVIRIAGNPRLFTFLSSAQGKIDVVEGDGRLQLAACDEQFGVLVLDAFGSDAIPLHLLTREAMEVYRKRLGPNGILALNVSNRYLDLEPVVANLCRDAASPLSAYVWADRFIKDHERAAGKFPSVWIVLANHEEDLPEALRAYPWRPARPRDDLPEWTDAWTNVWQVFHWRSADVDEPIQ